jgi:hypothetical protein
MKRIASGSGASKKEWLQVKIFFDDLQYTAVRPSR